MKGCSYFIQSFLVKPLIAFSSSNRLDPARLTMRVATGLLMSFSRSLVVFVIQSAFRREMSPSHKMNRPLISSRSGNGLCWCVSVKAVGAVSAERLNSLQRFNEFNAAY